MPVSVVIIEDSENDRVLTCARLAPFSGVRVVGSFNSYDLAVLVLSGLAPDVVLLDLDLPGTSGLQAAALLEKHFPFTKVLILSGCDCQKKTVLDALAAGAEGFLLKSESAQRLAHAIWRVHTGHTALSAEVADVMVKSFHGRLPLVVPLTALETTVLDARARGIGYKEIESEFNLSKTALKKCVGRILRKTFSDSTAQAVFHRAQLSLAEAG